MRWLGHACFYLESPEGVRIVTDPFGPDVPYPPVSVDCDVVTVSHEHFDHNNAAGVGGSPLVLRGVDPVTKRFRKINEKVRDATFRTVFSYHDDDGGKKRGENAIFVIDLAGLVFVHLGDLGEVPDQVVLDEIGRCDVLLVPVGGYYTIDAAQAQMLVDALRPRVAVPMHYKTRYTASWPIAGVDEFLARARNVKRLGSAEIRLTAADLPDDTETWVFDI